MGGARPADWLTLEEHRLRAVTGGGIYWDGLEPSLQAARSQLAYYPRDAWLYLLAARWSKIGQEEPFDSPYGLTASIHTKSIHRAIRFCDKAQTGVAVVNAGTHGSEPHMPFGGRTQSGNGSREPGTEALNIYSELKDLYINIDPASL